MSAGGTLGEVPYLALILFLPWFAILSVLFWFHPRTPRTAARRLFDILALLLSVVAFVIALFWSFDHADRSHGHLWPQVLATSVGYGVYLLAMTVAFFIRRAWLKSMPSR
ncbi:MAG: hypothetical protein Q4F49_06135 [Pseudoxanthomonas suwonensis]|nr:hypothetical protein [Pseudoxanthomonas suwonensis]